jgi:hypothetical protein
VSVETGVPLAVECRLPAAPRSTVYARAGRFDGQTEPCKRGLKTELTDAELLAEVKEIIRGNPFSARP